jgi:multimeric flavodoxin WrbA
MRAREINFSFNARATSRSLHRARSCARRLFSAPFMIVRFALPQCLFLPFALEFSLGWEPSMKTLVVYYSLWGNTRAVATAIAKELGADLEEIRCSRYSPGAWGFVRAAFDSLRGKLPPVEAVSNELSQYDRIVIGGPVWASHLATPVRAFLRHESTRLSQTAFFVTLGGTGSERALQEMKQMAGGAEPQATLAVRERDIKAAKYGAAVSDFVSKVDKARAA